MIGNLVAGSNDMGYMHPVADAQWLWTWKLGLLTTHRATATIDILCILYIHLHIWIQYSKKMSYNELYIYIHTATD